MRLSSVLCGLLLLAVPALTAWTKEDQEIFRLRDQVEMYDGEGLTFYGLLGLSPSASHEEINKAFKAKSKLLHPDKVKRSMTAKSKKGPANSKGKAKAPSRGEVDRAVKEATQRFARLGVVHDILRGPGRERYDYFLQNGFPRWRGTGYYYARYRPGLGSVLLGLFVVMGGGAHYGALYLGWKRQREFVDRYIRHARRTAWGDELGIRGIPGSGADTAVSNGADKGEMAMQGLNRRQRRLQEKENKRGKAVRDDTKSSAEATPPPNGPTGGKKRVVAENGKVLIVDSVGNVYMEQEDDEGNVQEFLLDIDEIPRPTVKDTVLWRLPIWLYRQSVGTVVNRVRGGPTDTEDDVPDESEEEDDPTSKARAALAPTTSRRRARRSGRARP